MEFLPERTCGLAANTDDTLAVRSVRSQFNIKNNIVKIKSFLYALTVLVLFVEDKHAVIACSLVFCIGNTKLSSAAEHAVAHDAAHFGRLYLHTVGEHRAIQCNGDLTADSYIGCIGNYLERFFPAHIDITNAKPLGVWMLLDTGNSANINILDPGHFRNYLGDLEASKKHSVCEFLVSYIIINIVFKPFKR